MESANSDDAVMELLEGALARPAAEREAWLAATGSGPEVIAEVLERAAWEERMHGFLETSLFGLAALASVVDAMPETVRIGHYLIQQVLGRGGMGVVFKALDQNLGRTVALKVLSGAFDSAADRRRFLREAKAASALSHPNIVAIHEFDSDAGQDFIAMEYIEGQTLDRAGVEASLPARLDYARQIALALATAHTAGIVHRDLKPGNIMVTRRGEVKVLDFGLAKQQHLAPLSEAEATVTTEALTLRGDLVGTPSFMSPEQVTGERVDARSDIFSFGVILYLLFTGERPFTGVNIPALLVQIASKPHRPVRAINPEIPIALADLIDRCLEKSPEKRLASMDEAASRLAEIQSGADVRSSRRWWMGAAAVLAMGAAGAIWWPRPAPPAPVHALRYALVGDGGAVLSPATTFRAGARVRLRLGASHSGSLYVVNEGPGEQGRTRLFVLLPRPGGTSTVAAGEERLTDWLVFDENPGIERVWIVWSGQAIPEFEAAVRSPAQGLVDDAGAVAGMLETLRGATAGVTASANEVRRSGAGRLGSRLELRHE